ncbi:MAG TPA: hypothetical protein VEF04_09170, partial [Blastocatellia bacterium]|nr:hypothetical protein [Blastocatellia bacterium]
MPKVSNQLSGENVVNKTFVPSLNLQGIIILLLLFVSSIAINAQRKADGENGTYAIRNARIVTVTGATIERGTVIVRDGKIAAVGASVNIPANARIIDATGLSVYPGMIDAGTTLGLQEI